MQFFALTEEHETIDADSAERKKDYICMECAGLVRVRQGELRRSHFYHYRETPGCRQAGKSLEHLQAQIYIHQLFSGKTILEKRFDQINRIADVVLEDQKVIFEVQCSPILAQEVMSRNCDYEKCGYRVIWILHDSRYGGKRKTSAEHFLQKSAHYYTNMNAAGEGCIYDRLWGPEAIRRPVEGAILPIKYLKHEDFRLKIRLANWKVRLKGDLLGSSLFLQKPVRASLWTRFKAFYRKLLYIALETASR